MGCLRTTSIGVSGWSQVESSESTERCRKERAAVALPYAASPKRPRFTQRSPDPGHPEGNPYTPFISDGLWARAFWKQLPQNCFVWGLRLAVGSSAVMHVVVDASAFASIIRMFLYASCRRSGAQPLLASLTSQISPVAAFGEEGSELGGISEAL